MSYCSSFLGSVKYYVVFQLLFGCFSVIHVVASSSSEETTCEEGQFKCLSAPHRCINRHWVCDGDNDCVDGSDEKSETCAGKNHDEERRRTLEALLNRLTELERARNATCEVGHFKCPTDNECIDDDWLCDGDKDCNDGADEEPANCLNKANSMTCKSSEFKCTNGQKCIKRKWLCDKDNDCNDKSDEDPKNCQVQPPVSPNDTICTRDQYRCTREHECINKVWVCDGEQDCDDGTDEASCQQVVTPYKFKAPKTPKLILSCKNNLKIIELSAAGEGTFQEIRLPPEIKSISAMTYNSISDKLILSDSESKKLYEFDLATSKLKVVVEGNLNTVTAMDIDVVGQNLYWVDTGRGTIEVMSLHTKARIVLEKSVKHLQNIFVSPKLGALFWIESKFGVGTGHGVLHKMDLNGGRKTKIRNLNALGIAYEMESGKVLWIDADTGTIQSMWTNGTTIGVHSNATSVRVKAKSQVPHFIAVYNSQVFWTYESSPDVNSTSLYGKSRPQQIYRAGKDSSGNLINGGFLIVGRGLTSLENLIGSHDCSAENSNFKNCSQVCAPSGPGLTGKCICQSGLSLGRDGLTCLKSDRSKSGWTTAEPMFMLGSFLAVFVIDGLNYL